MPDLNLTSIALDINDNNIIFNKNYITDEFIRGFRSKVYHGTLKYKPSYCSNCGVVYKNNNIISKGYSKPSLIKLPSIVNFNTYLRLKKQRYQCKECNTSFTLKTSIVEKFCFLSNSLRYQVAKLAEMKIYEKEIGKIVSISHSSVARIIDSYFAPQKLYKDYLPEVIGMDEFKSVKSADGKMSYIFADLNNKKVIDIVEDRRLYKLEKYFSYYTQTARDNVKYIVIDMYIPYIELSKKMFRNANIIIDRFHLVQHMKVAMQKTRIQSMKRFKTHSYKYRLLKKHFILLNKFRYDLDNIKYRRWTRNSELMTTLQFVDHILSFDDSLKESYWIYQDFLKGMKYNDFKHIKSITNKKDFVKSQYLITALSTLNNYLPYIKNTLESNYTNGYVEGFNNLVKVKKRMAFGYRSFRRFKNRILIVSKKIEIKKGLKSW